MRSLSEVVNDLNAIKTERAHTRIVVPSEAQADENYRIVGALLEGTGIDQAELAGASMNVGASALESVAHVDGGIDGGELLALFASLWVDGVVTGARFMREAASELPSQAPDKTNRYDAGQNPPTTDPSRLSAQRDPRGERDR